MANGKMKRLWYIEVWNGSCGIRDYDTRSIQKAQQQAILEEGASNITKVRVATKDDIEMVRAMGGYVPGYDADKRQEATP